MSSPNLNYSILAGCILCYISSIFLGLDSNFVPKSALRHMCTIQIWLLSLGFTIAFGSVTVKSWRIYKIFFNPTKIRMVIRDIQLFGRLIQLLAVDIVILSLWTTIDPITIMENNIGSPKRIVTANIETIVMHRIQICYSKYTSVWLAVTLSYKLLLLLVGVFLAWKTRKVSIDSLNDSHSLAMTVYNIFVLSCTGIIVGIASNLILDAQFAMQASFIILCTTSSMGLLFIPKISQVKIHPIQVTSSSKLDKQVRESFQKSTLSQKNLELELRKLKLIISEKEMALVTVSCIRDDKISQLQMPLSAVSNFIST
ncbi:uncharacterized protein TRIADDRAFT_60056 [Trichoplax adhaerens]|uniref:G-protein coupled receptors family 3 profile domain-containing protein n=1 Tax=Trichoplax adhaerens TaxID=10228 RepID=B3S763_TRIAD|nr:hypothetical protein TRIADDRAFT_60056 [Trichoplax adhaerens]EDV21428.1 hypothetical protein TRIADDRAFT_60056 [Trichoplax adhaerens]|eukprot:XP_002116028.1 hypothetical protein TRIADDRAFT_60056 [Trichoplax adhaerens]